VRGVEGGEELSGKQAHVSFPSNCFHISLGPSTHTLTGRPCSGPCTSCPAGPAFHPPLCFGSLATAWSTSCLLPPLLLPTAQRTQKWPIQTLLFMPRCTYGLSVAPLSVGRLYLSSSANFHSAYSIHIHPIPYSCPQSPTNQSAQFKCAPFIHIHPIPLVLTPLIPRQDTITPQGTHAPSSPAARLHHAHGNRPPPQALPLLPSHVVHFQRSSSLLPLSLPPRRPLLDARLHHGHPHPQPDRAPT